MNALCPSSYVAAAIFYKSVRYLEPVYMGPKMSDVIESDAMKKPSHTIKKPSDAPEGMKLCRKCAEFLPLEQFYATQNSIFECKTHLRERNACRRKVIMSNPLTKVVLNLWDIFRTDGKKIFHQETLGVNEKDVRDLFLSKGITPTSEWRVVPIYPDETWGVNNIDVVSKQIRKILMATMSTNGRDDEKRYVKTYIALKT
jgi:hypothetical protein